MSKGEVVDHLGEGLYRVRQKLAVERIQAELVKVNNRIAELAILVPEKKLALLQAENKVADKVREIDLLIPDLAAGVEGARQKITDIQLAIVRMQSEIRQLELTVADLVAQNLAALKRRNQLESVAEDRAIDAWCADYTLDLSGEVGLVDVDDQGGRAVHIQPGYQDGADYSVTRDGALFPDLAQSGPQIYFNAAILPGVQKWMPRYRLAQITALQGDECSIVLDPAVSSAQSLNINEAQSFQNVPIQYMECNGAAFQVGDRVLVRFFDSGPQVVGFETNPKPCQLFGLAFIPSQIVYEAGVVSRLDFGLPEIPGDPLGTPGGSNPAWHYTNDDGAGYQFEKYQPTNFGGNNWLGPEGLVLSWGRTPSRALNGLRSSRNSAWTGFSVNTTTEVFRGGQKLLDMSDYAPGSINSVGATSTHLHFVVARFDNFIFREIPWDGTTPGNSHTDLLTYARDPDWELVAGWHFSEDGLKAIMTERSAGNPQRLRVVRWSKGAGISHEVIWERSQIGTMTVSFTGTGDPLSSGNYAQGTRTRIDSVPSHSVPIYVDFVGNEEVTLYVRYGEYQSQRVEQVSTGGQPYEREDTEQQGATEFVLSTGEVIATLPPAIQRTESANTAPRDDGRAPASKTQSASRRIFSGANSYFDIRFKAAIVETIELDIDETLSGDPGAIGVVGSGTLPGASQENNRIVYRGFRQGATLFTLATQELNETLSSGSIYVEDIGVPTAEFSNSSPLDGQALPTVSYDNSVLSLGIVASGSIVFATVATFHAAGSANLDTDEWKSFNYSSVHGNVQQELFGGRADMTFFMPGLL
ncbi:hypothetical protein [Marinobacter shengliensis]|uniref:hypothetical protein n=1 Tax=Marinobacter shengliensis TaxID=1389223 RepID=UPI001E634E12|nr:hypothetical protein [Marinobacter shengliensis]MCD1631342.1 hypothetical protein [Marinobacter shengliensis]